jgi:predicted Zn-dependent protease
MQDYFNTLVESIPSMLQAEHEFTAWFEAEVSDFVRFNQGKVRQPGSVTQAYLDLRVVKGKKQNLRRLCLSGQKTDDLALMRHELQQMSDLLPQLEDDPHLLLATQSNSNENSVERRLCDSSEIVDSIVKAVEGVDFVGIYAGGDIFRGFANSFGQRNWFSTANYNLDFSLYYANDKAVKASLAGFEWKSEAFQRKLEASQEQLRTLQKPAKTIEAGDYRVYLAPAAVEELLQLISWGGFGLASHRTKQTPLLKMLTGDECLHTDISIVENTRSGASPCFQAQGFMRPDEISLIHRGKLAQTLNAPRSSMEYGVDTNGANAAEVPESLEMAAGDLGTDEIYNSLGTGLLINNLWYLNYSDRSGGRITGMTRFATLWVEDGQVQSPVNVMRFDDTVYAMLGKKLAAITRDRDFMMSTSTYGSRSTSSCHVPGILLEGLTLTL